MFEVGDKVWAKTYNYSMTSYHRPCEVISVNKLHLGRIVVRIAKTGGGYEVDACEFEHKEGYLINAEIKDIRKVGGFFV